MADKTDSRLLEERRTTLRPVMEIFSVKWSTATLDGAHTRTCDCTGQETFVKNAREVRVRHDSPPYTLIHARNEEMLMGVNM